MLSAAIFVWHYKGYLCRLEKADSKIYICKISAGVELILGVIATSIRTLMSITCEGIIHLTIKCQRADNNLHLENFILSPWPKVI